MELLTEVRGCLRPVWRLPRRGFVGSAAQPLLPCVDAPHCFSRLWSFCASSPVSELNATLLTLHRLPFATAYEKWYATSSQTTSAELCYASMAAAQLRNHRKLKQALKANAKWDHHILTHMESGDGGAKTMANLVPMFHHFTRSCFPGIRSLRIRQEHEQPKAIRRQNWKLEGHLCGVFVTTASRLLLFRSSVMRSRPFVVVAVHVQRFASGAGSVHHAHAIGCQSALRIACLWLVLNVMQGCMQFDTASGHLWQATNSRHAGRTCLMSCY